MNRSPFAGFERRAAGVIIDFLAMFFVAGAIQVSILARLDLGVGSLRPVFFAVAVLYFTLSWTSALGATPVQWLLRMRVVNKAGERLSLSRAALRAMLLVGGIEAAMTLFLVPEKPWFLTIAAPTVVLLFLAALTTNRQGIHDLLAGSLVVMRDAVKTSASRNNIREYVAANDLATRAKRRPKAFRILVAGMLVFVVLFGMYNIALLQFDRELRYRVEYAYRETGDLRAALLGAKTRLGYWATTKEELGAETRAAYPDGGYYQLEENGVIRIRFTVIPKLKKISVIIGPNWNGEEFVWACRVEGEISQGMLPARCRE